MPNPTLFKGDLSTPEGKVIHTTFGEGPFKVQSTQGRNPGGELVVIIETPQGNIPVSMDWLVSV